MPLPNINYGAGQDSMQDVFDKTNAGLTDSGKSLVSSNDTTSGYLNGKLVAGDNVTLTEVNDGGDETLTIDTVTRETNNETWTGSQALTGSYATVGTLSYTTPNDGVTRTYLIIAETVGSATNAATDNQINIKLRNFTASTDLQTVSIAFPEIGAGSTAKHQGTVFYVGSIGPNVTLIVQAQEGAGTVTALSGSLTAVELSR